MPPRQLGRGGGKGGKAASVHLSYYHSPCAVNYNLALDVHFFSAQCTRSQKEAAMKQVEEIRLRCTQQQYETIKEAADQIGLSISAYVRMAALSNAQARLEAADGR